MAEKVRTAFRHKLLLVGGSVLVTAVLLEACLRLAAAVWLAQQQQRNLEALRHSGGVRIMCVGESTTALGGANSYPSQLQEILSARYPKVSWSVVNAGVVGMNSTYIVAQLQNRLAQFRPQVLVVMMGINDSGDFLEFEAGPWQELRSAIKSLRTYKLAVSLFRHAREKYPVLQGPVPGAQEREVLEKTQALLDGGDRSPSNLEEYFTLAWLYKTRGDFTNTEKVLRIIQEIVAQAEEKERYSFFGDMAVIELARLAYEQKDIDQALRLLVRKSAEGELRAVAFVEMGWIYRALGKTDQARQSFLKAIELRPDYYEPYVELGWMEWSRGEVAIARKFFLKAIDLNPRDEQPFMGVAAILQDKPDEKDLGVVLRMLKDSPYNDKAIGAVRVLSRLRNDPKELRKVLAASRGIFYYRQTVENYRLLQKMAEERGILLVCVQYPMRSVKPLRAAMDTSGDIVFVDNERSFQHAVAKEGFRAYFIDAFAGDFGHCTPKGNRLLAENVARGVAEGYFHRAFRPGSPQKRAQ